jgi:acyl carrier protein
MTGPAAAANPAVLESVVREAIADHFQLDPATIDMSLPLSGSPVNADGLDVLEVGQDIMERLEIPIPQDRWDKFLDEETGTEPIGLTPAGLVRLFQEVGRGPEKVE